MSIKYYLYRTVVGYSGNDEPKLYKIFDDPASAIEARDEMVIKEPHWHLWDVVVQVGNENREHMTFYRNMWE